MAGLQGAPAPAPALDTGAGWKCRTLATPSVKPPELSTPALAPPPAAPQVVIEVKKEMDASLAVLTQARVPTFTFPRHKRDAHACAEKAPRGLDVVPCSRGRTQNSAWTVASGYTAAPTTLRLRHTTCGFPATQVFLLALALVLGHLLQRKKVMWLGEAATALLLGLVVGVVCTYALPMSDVYLSWIGFKKEFFFIALLPPIIFEGGFHATSQTVRSLPMLLRTGVFTTYSRCWGAFMKPRSHAQVHLQHRCDLHICIPGDHGLDASVWHQHFLGRRAAPVHRPELP